jgi:hypothetical protein
MNYRPYPTTARALHQLGRHEHPADVPVLTMSPAMARTMGSMAAALRNVRVPPAQTIARAFPTSADAGARLAAGLRAALPSLGAVAATGGQPGPRTTP